MRRVPHSRGFGRVFRIAAIAGVAVLASAAAAAAKNAYSLDVEVGTVNGWHIAANEARQGCLAFGSYRSGTVIEVGIDRRRDTAFMLFANANWKFIRVDERYDVVLTFNGRKRWTGVATGVHAGQFPGLALEGIKSAFVGDFAAYNSVRLDYAGSRLDGFDLAGTRSAVENLLSCTAEVRDGRIALGKGEEPAPRQPEERQAPPQRETPQPKPDATEASRPREQKKGPSYSTGTGFFVDAQGHLVTNAHVVEDCSEARLKLPDGSIVNAEIKARSPQNDLAVLQASYKPASWARLRAGSPPRLGETIVVFGYPLAGELTVTGNLSTGLVSALAGPGEDVTRMQISAPVQSGNSGGAVADLSGRVVGVVVAKADTKTRSSGSVEVLQNVNFAIKSNVLSLFLDANQVPYAQEASGTDKSVADVAAVAREFSALVICKVDK